jgi:GMP synthase-like glutamine amidotransferase
MKFVFWIFRPGTWSAFILQMVLFELLLLTAALTTKTSRRFCVINCENIPWQPTSFADMFKETMNLDELAAWDVCNAADGEQLPEDIASYTGVIITGSHFDCRSSRTQYFQWFDPIKSFIRSAAAQGQPKVFGSCFGCNLVALSLGGVVAPNPGSRYVLKIEDIIPERNFYDIFSQGSGIVGISSSKVIPPLRNKYSVISTHEDCVEVLPPESILLGSTPLCQNHLFVTGKFRNILGCQSHPEFDLQYAVMDRIWPSIALRLKCLSEEEMEESLRSFDTYTGEDATELCTLIAAFLHSN